MSNYKKAIIKRLNNQIELMQSVPEDDERQRLLEALHRSLEYTHNFM